MKVEKRCAKLEMALALKTDTLETPKDETALMAIRAEVAHAFGPVLAVRSSPNTLESAGVLNITLKRTRDLDDVHHDSKSTHRHDRLRLLS